VDAEPVPSECPKKLTPGIHRNSARQVRDLDAQGFQIGCHSMTHPYLSDLTEPELKALRRAQPTTMIIAE
jgi:peptidoglycan/xylan/chitin deacetylase (PgdA/CDA1 family)